MFAAGFEVLKAIWNIGKWEIIKGIVVSPKTLTMLIVGLLSALGVFVSYKTKKKMYGLISGILAMIDFLLMFS